MASGRASAYNADGTLNKITEPAGRYLQLSYTDKPNGITPIMSSTTFPRTHERQVVDYSLSMLPFSREHNLTILTRFILFRFEHRRRHPTPTAPNTPGTFGLYNGTPMLATFDDSMYAGSV